MAEQQFFDPKNEALHYENHLELSGEQKPQFLKLLREKLELYKRQAARRSRVTKETRELSERIRRNNEELESIQKEQDAGEKKVAARMRALLSAEQRRRFDDLETERLRQQREFQQAHRGPGRHEPGGAGAMGDNPGVDGSTPVRDAGGPPRPR